MVCGVEFLLFVSGYDNNDHNNDDNDSIINNNINQVYILWKQSQLDN